MTIFVVGFPKSGNTWLSKMLCHAFNAVLVDDDPSQLEVNDRLDNLQNDIRIVKSHHLPEQLLKNYPTDEYRIFYVYRDFRDVSISALFYFNGPVNQGLLLDKNFCESIMHFSDPLDFQAGRLAIKNYVGQMSDHGIPELSQFSTWSQHIETWLEWGKTHSNQFQTLTYSDLRADTENQLARAIKKLGLEQFIQSLLCKAIEKESFETLKTEFIKKKLHSNASFLRSGIVGDWKNYYTQEIAEALSGSVMLKLNELGFETDNLWVNQLPKEKLSPQNLQEFMLFWKCRLKHLLS